MHIIEDEDILSTFNNNLSNDGIRLEKFGSEANKLHERQMVFGQTPFALNSIQAFSPPLIIQTNKGFRFRKDGSLSIIY